MPSRKPLATAAVLVLLCLVWNHNALGAIFQPGDFITYSQQSWGEPTDPGGMTIIAHYDSVYASTAGQIEIGIPGTSGFSIIFTGRDPVLAYQPSTGPHAPLSADLVDPLSSASGIFGGEVLALRFNIDFSDAGHTLGSLGIPFGDLVIHDLSELPQWNGLSVRQALAQLDTLLGGGTTGYSALAGSSQAFNLNISFVSGEPSPWAQDHLRIASAPGAVPELASVFVWGGLALLAMPRLVHRTRRSGF
jgi:hypothetical protein